MINRKIFCKSGPSLPSLKSGPDTDSAGVVTVCILFGPAVLVFRALHLLAAIMLHIKRHDSRLPGPMMYM